MIKCAYCEDEARTKSGMAMHLRGAHPQKWKGSVTASFPKGFDPGTPEPKRKRKSKLTEEQKVIRRKQQKDWYDKHRRKRGNHLEDPRGYINCCPHCGEQLAAYYLAKGAMNRRMADQSLSVLQEGLRRAESRK